MEAELQRLDREREFHNSRFLDETREAQGKYYAAIKDGARAFERRMLALAEEADVLEYGCGSAMQGSGFASSCRSLTGIDISDVAIELAQSRFAGQSNVRYLTMNAEDMTFEDASFDLVVGRGIIHHLDLDRALSSVARVLRPGGRALFWEPMGHNPLINFYRRRTPSARTVDEHPLTRSDIEGITRYLEISDLRFYGLTTILSVPFRDTPFGNRLLKALARFDRLAYRTPARWMAWHTLIELRKST